MPNKLNENYENLHLLLNNSLLIVLSLRWRVLRRVLYTGIVQIFRRPADVWIS